MKILFIHHCDTWGGAGVSLFSCCEMLMNYHQLTVCLPHDNTEVASQLRELPIKITAINNDMGMIAAYNGGPKFLSRTFFKSLLRIRKCIKGINSVLDEENYDIVIVNSMTTSWICKLTYKRNLPSVVYIRETKPRRHLGFSIIKYCIEKYSFGRIFISEYDKDVMHFCPSVKGGERNKDLVLGNSIHPEKYESHKSRETLLKEKNIDPAKMIVLFVGGTDPLKGYDILIKAVELLNNPSIQLLVAGVVPEERRIKGVHYLGKVMNMACIYTMADVLVFPSIAGHQARPAFEAGACHIPVIISDFPATADEVRNGYNGLTFKPRDSKELADRIDYFVNHPKERKKMGENNYTLSMERHDFEKNKKRINNFLSENIIEQ